MAEETFITYRNYRWLWIMILSLLVFGLIYLLDDPVGGPSGGTFLGYTYGVIATAGILYLMWYGIRKRAYYSRFTTLKGSLAAHIWIGVGLIFLVPLHAGFSFGLNVHTLAYVLMLGVIFSGVWGIVLYSKMPSQLVSQRGGGTVGELIEQIHVVSSDIKKLAVGAKKAVNEDGGATVLVSDAFLKLINDLDFEFKPSLMRSVRGRNPAVIDRKRMADLLVKLPTEEQEEGLKVISLINKKRELVCRVQDEARAMTWVRAWLYLHLPLSIGLMVALVIHIVSVFYYW